MEQQEREGKKECPKYTLAIDQLEHPETAHSVQTHTTSFRQNIPFSLLASGIKGYLCLIARIPVEQMTVHTSVNPSTLDFTLAKPRMKSPKRFRTSYEPFKTKVKPAVATGCLSRVMRFQWRGKHITRFILSIERVQEMWHHFHVSAIKPVILQKLCFKYIQEHRDKPVYPKGHEYILYVLTSSSDHHSLHSRLAVIYDAFHLDGMPSTTHCIPPTIFPQELNP